MKSIDFLFKTFWLSLGNGSGMAREWLGNESVNGSSRALGMSTSGQAYIEHTLSIYSAYIGTSRKAGGKKYGTMRNSCVWKYAACLFLCMVLCVGNVWGTVTSTLTFTSSCGGSGTADNGIVWTVTSDADESTYDGTKGIHYGTASAAVSYLTLSTSAIEGTITAITVNASGAASTTAKLNVTVGGNAFGSEQSLTASAADYELTGSASGAIVVSITQSSDKRALYCKSIEVTYTPPTYTVTYNAGTGTCKSSDTEASGGSGVTLAKATPPSKCATDGWSFVGWKRSSALSTTTTIPELFPGGSTFYPTADETLYAVYKVGITDTIDFESSIASYDWTFTNISSQGTDANVTAHGGSYIGLTKNTTSLQSIITKSAIESPKYIQFYISKTTTNTTASSWKIYTSANGSTWGDEIKSQDAVSMSQGEWIKVTQDLSSYSNVYIKIEYGTSGAIRCIDDVILSSATFASNPECTYDYFVDIMHGTVVEDQLGTYTMPTIADKSEGSYCQGKHYIFIGWLEYNEDNIDTDGTLKAGAIANIIPGGVSHTASEKTYIAIWDED